VDDFFLVLRNAKVIKDFEKLKKTKG